MICRAVLENAVVRFTEDGVPFSETFSDVYFAKEGGLAQARHVFLAHNGLPHRWLNHKDDTFCILETGFGTGLNFLLTLQAFQPHGNKNKKLRFVSLEGFPLTKSDLALALAAFPELSEQSAALLAQYPEPFRGWHTLYFNHVELILIFDRLADAWPQLHKSTWRFDAFYLDGFAPAKNADMWSEEVLTRLGKLCNESASFATFTASGQVRRHLQTGGFTVTKSKGFGAKRDMLHGVFSHPIKHSFTRLKAPTTKTENIAIVGNGISAATMAFALKQKNIHATIIAPHATGGALTDHDVAIAGPRWSLDHNIRSQIMLSGLQRLSQAIQTVKSHRSVLHHGCIDLLSQEVLQTRKAQFKTLGLQAEIPISLEKVLENIDQIKSETLSIFFDPYALGIAPQWLIEDLFAFSQCKQIAKRVYSWQTNHQHIELLFDDGSSEKYSAAIFCTGADSAQIFPEMPLHLVRGQTTLLSSDTQLDSLGHSIRFDGYFCPQYNGEHLLGATFEHNNDSVTLSEQSQQLNLDALSRALPGLKLNRDPELKGHVGFRLTTKDRFPIAGEHPQHSGLYLNMAHGAQGLLTSFVCSALLADTLCGDAPALPSQWTKALSPLRFINP